jgi:hypothetical protein
MFYSGSYPSEGIFAINLFIRGRPMVVTLDDYLPFYNGKLIFGAKSSANGNLWASLLEKAFAKITGNYE